MRRELRAVEVGRELTAAVEGAGFVSATGKKGQYVGQELPNDCIFYAGPADFAGAQAIFETRCSRQIRPLTAGHKALSGEPRRPATTPREDEAPAEPQRCLPPPMSRRHCAAKAVTARLCLRLCVLRLSVFQTSSGRRKHRGAEITEETRRSSASRCGPPDVFPSILPLELSTDFRDTRTRSPLPPRPTGTLAFQTFKLPGLSFPRCPAGTSTERAEDLRS